MGLYLLPLLHLKWGLYLPLPRLGVLHLPLFSPSADLVLFRFLGHPRNVQSLPLPSPMSPPAPSLMFPHLSPMTPSPVS